MRVLVGTVGAKPLLPKRSYRVFLLKGRGAKSPFSFVPRRSDWSRSHVLHKQMQHCIAVMPFFIGYIGMEGILILKRPCRGVKGKEVNII